MTRLKSSPGGTSPLQRSLLVLGWVGVLLVGVGLWHVYEFRFQWPTAEWEIFFGGAACFVCLYGLLIVRSVMSKNAPSIQLGAEGNLFRSSVIPTTALALAVSGLVLLVSMGWDVVMAYASDKRLLLFVLSGLLFLLSAALYPVVVMVLNKRLATRRATETGAKIGAPAVGDNVDNDTASCVAIEHQESMVDDRPNRH